VLLFAVAFAVSSKQYIASLIDHTHGGIMKASRDTYVVHL
jgi:hypothetical protein